MTDPWLERMELTVVRIAETLTNPNLGPDNIEAWDCVLDAQWERYSEVPR